MPRRSRAAFERAVENASTDRSRAAACFDLAVFHDNNSREDDAIPYYREALALGLDAVRRPQALAWLASSLHKTGVIEEAREVAQEAERLAREPHLVKWIQDLRGRIEQGS